MSTPTQIELQVVAVKKPEDLNLILGQSTSSRPSRTCTKRSLRRFRACGLGSRSASPQARGSYAGRATIPSSSSWRPATRWRSA